MPPPTTRSGRIYNRMDEQQLAYINTLPRQEQEAITEQYNNQLRLSSGLDATRWLNNLINQWRQMGTGERAGAILGGFSGFAQGDISRGIDVGRSAGRTIDQNLSTNGGIRGSERNTNYPSIFDEQMDQIIASKSFFNLPCTTHVRTTN